MDEFNVGDKVQFNLANTGATVYHGIVTRIFKGAPLIRPLNIQLSPQANMINIKKVTQ